MSPRPARPFSFKTEKAPTILRQSPASFGQRLGSLEAYAAQVACIPLSAIDLHFDASEVANAPQSAIPSLSSAGGAFAGASFGSPLHFPASFDTVALRMISQAGTFPPWLHASKIICAFNSSFDVPLKEPTI